MKQRKYLRGPYPTYGERRDASGYSYTKTEFRRLRRGYAMSGVIFTFRTAHAMARKQAW